mmetsp:Transcript_4934/g.7611  ORF Transcript_4934/g.7611 Transcript_4934/m.7611 type:complete len:102 (+) Transcript_4934:310-615(+)
MEPSKANYIHGLNLVALEPNIVAGKLDPHCIMTFDGGDWGAACNPCVDMIEATGGNGVFAKIFVKSFVGGDGGGGNDIRDGIGIVQRFNANFRVNVAHYSE